MNNVEIKVIDVEYSNVFGSFQSDEGNIFAIVNFEVYTDLEPEQNFYWSPNSFISSLNVRDKLLSQVSSIPSKKGEIYANQKTEATVFISIPENEKLTSVSICHPLNQQEVININVEE